MGEEEAQLIIRIDYIKKEIEELEILMIEDKEEARNKFFDGDFENEEEWGVDYNIDDIIE